MKIQQKIERLPIKIDDSIRRKTYTTIFLLPCLGLDKNELDKFGFVNAYLEDTDYDVDYNMAIYLLFECDLDEEFDEFIDKLSKLDIFLEEYDVSFRQVMVILRFPEQWKKEYKYFKEGRYSKFSKKYIDSYFPMTKKEIKDGIVKTVSSVFAGIFNKEEWLRKYWEQKLGTDILPNEYWSIPDIKKEVFRNGEH